MWGIEPRWNEGGHVKIKAVKCGKTNCNQCPHKFYAYHVNRWGEKYLGVCDSEGRPRVAYENPRQAQKQTKLPGIAKKA